jgi:hypothetical protein
MAVGSRTLSLPGVLVPQVPAALVRSPDPGQEPWPGAPCSCSACSFPSQQHPEAPAIGRGQQWLYVVIDSWESYPDLIGVHYGPCADKAWLEHLQGHHPGAEMATHSCLKQARIDYCMKHRQRHGDINDVPVKYFEWAPPVSW